MLSRDDLLETGVACCLPRREMPGYPTVDRDNDFLIARFDGAVLDAKPWGPGALSGVPSASPPPEQEPADAVDSGLPSASALAYTPAQAAVLRQLRSLEVILSPPPQLSVLCGYTQDLYAPLGRCTCAWTRVAPG